MSPNWIEHRLLPGYIISRGNIVLSEAGAKNNCPEPALGKNERGELAYWVRPIRHPAMLMIRIEGLKNLFENP